MQIADSTSSVIDIETALALLKFLRCLGIKSSEPNELWQKYMYKLMLNIAAS